MIIAPALIPLIGLVGFTSALALAALILIVVLVAIVARLMRGRGREPEDLGLGPDGDLPLSQRTEPSPSDEGRGRADAVRTWRFWSVSVPFALGLTAQVGVLTHLIALLTPTLGAGGAARAVSATTAVVGINQFTFAFGPSLVGVLRDWSGTYSLALGACTVLQGIAATIIMLGPGRTQCSSS